MADDAFAQFAQTVGNRIGLEGVVIVADVAEDGAIRLQSNDAGSRRRLQPVEQLSVRRSGLRHPFKHL